MGSRDNTNTPAAIRIRDNQRRSRARHKEYVENLQRKVQEYERQGVAATLEMQRAARDVAVENSRLRALLTKKGVSAEEVDAYLKSFGDSNGNAAATIAGLSAAPITPVFDTPSNASNTSTLAATPTIAPSQTPSKVLLEPAPKTRSRNNSAGSTFSSANSTRQVVDAAVGIRRDHSGKDYASPMSLTHLMNGDDLPPLRLPPSPGPSRPLDKLSALADAINSQRSKNDCCGGFTQCSGVSQNTDHLPVRSSLEPPESYAEGSSLAAKNANSSSSEASMDTSPHEMSCDVAANIIAGMHGTVDTEAARNALGCKGREECMVKNTRLFHVLEDVSRMGPP